MVVIVKFGVAEKILSATLINVNAGFAQAVQSSNFSLRIRFLVCAEFWSAPTCGRFSLLRPIAD
jgi:hypothetical protein